MEVPFKRLFRSNSGLLRRIPSQIAEEFLFGKLLFSDEMVNLAAHGRSFTLLHYLFYQYEEWQVPRAGKKPKPFQQFESRHIRKHQRTEYHVKRASGCQSQTLFTGVPLDKFEIY